MTSTDSARTGEATLDRRQLLKAGAWAAPVVVLAASVPAAAASTTPVALTLSAAPGDRKIEVKGINCIIKLSGTLSAGGVAVTAVISFTPKAPNTTVGTWQLPVNGSTHGTESREIVATSKQTGSIVFNFPTYQGAAKGAAYDFNIIFSVGTTVVGATTGSFVAE